VADPGHGPESSSPGRTGWNGSRAAASWDDHLTLVAAGLLLYGGASGLAVWLLPFSVFSQLNVLVHTVVGLTALPALVLYTWRHWQRRRRGAFNHYQLLGYGAATLLAVCLVSGLVVTWQGALGDRMGAGWQAVHLYSGVAVVVLTALHLAAILWDRTASGRPWVATPRRRFLAAGVGGTALLTLLTGVWAAAYRDPPVTQGFVAGYDWRFGPDQPFLPSLARLEAGDLRERTTERVAAVLEPADRSLFLGALASLEARPMEQVFVGLERLDHAVRHDLEAVKRRVGALGHSDRIREVVGSLGVSRDRRERIEAILAESHEEVRSAGAVDPRTLARSDRCGTCHRQIYEEWLPSAHRYASLDVSFQAIQELTAQEVSPAHTRYCAGCHDPISLFAGAKNPQAITLGAEGFEEGISCVVCHSITRADIRGNADYVLELQARYAYELHDSPLAKFASDFLIRTYPRQHVASFSRPLYRTAEYCGACHKQFIDEMLNQDIGMVLAQNQYDSWRGSPFHDPADRAATVTCRECHMRLKESTDPAAGDLFEFDAYRSPKDGMHREHRFLGANQVIPVLQGLEGGEEQVRLVEAWLRGEIEIPEIADRWPAGPAVELRILAPPRAVAGEPLTLRVVTHNNKVGHDFPTGPLDVIQSWVELEVVAADGAVLHHSGGLDASGRLTDPLILYKSDPYDRHGDRLWRHELWNLVGSRDRRSLFPGQSDVVAVELGPALTGDLTVNAVLWYRKFHPRILELLLGPESGLTMPTRILGGPVDVGALEIPTTDVARATMTIRVEAAADAGAR
jgi:hypothetical protein